VFENIEVDSAGGDLGDDLEVFGSVSIASDREQKAVVVWPVAQYKRIARFLEALGNRRAAPVSQAHAPACLGRRARPARGRGRAC
jgi:hypothetical protein